MAPCKSDNVNPPAAVAAAPPAAAGVPLLGIPKFSTMLPSASTCCPPALPLVMRGMLSLPGTVDVLAP
eukprot:CAMPEP_0201865908 /NCGR_PEP_ID=MMETSP0902-20130614/674_1 /ASSEMBLY_ACC=CAM_ASM_000551 /TAXON_ID=420261 /ORGANISM="Thalassiosira antarctica, Strain CCMP982" /LENGTH=67 /DNA_ID=CAMNT_0048390775 /DNA_START=21 /DNA_END=221 /DNA_ORIENTATION=-